MHQGWLRGVGWLAIVTLLASVASAGEKEKKSQIVVRPSPDGSEEGAADTENSPPQDDRLVALGALTGSNLYTTYGYIGTVADAHQQGIYKAKRVRELMTEVIALAEANSRHLTKVRDGNLIDNDKKILDEFLAIYKLLEEEAEALSDYSRSESKTDFERFGQARSAAWPRLKTILGIKTPVAEAEGNGSAR